MRLRRKRRPRRDSRPASSFSMPFCCSEKDLRCRTNSQAESKYEWRNREMRWRKFRKIRKIRRCCRQMKTCRGRNISAPVRVLFHNKNRFLPYDCLPTLSDQDILRLFSAYLQAFRLHMTPLVMYNTGRMLSFYVET